MIIGFHSRSALSRAISSAFALAVLGTAALNATARPDPRPLSACVSSVAALCLNSERFKVEVQWRNFEGITGAGQALPLTGDTGYFWFFSSTNVELVVKVLDARGLNGHFWVFYGALSNVEYRITVTDTATGSVKTYSNPSGSFGSVGDTSAFTDSVTATSTRETLTSEGQAPAGGWFEIPATVPDSPSSAAACAENPTSLLLSDCRFRVSVSWTDFAGNTGSGQAVSLTADTGYFWFFTSNNVELIVKVLDARALNGNFWVFYGALSNVAYAITVTDTTNGQVKTYLNPSGHFGSAGDTGAFPPIVASSEELIDRDLKAGTITDEQALIYRVYVAYGSPSLPAKYRSTAAPGIDLPIAKTVAKRFPTLSAAAQAALQPYLLPPIYPGSWGDPAFVASIQSGRARLEVTPRVAVCGPLPGWGHKLTDHFNIWYRTVIPPGFAYSLAETENAATNIAAVAEHVWGSLTGNFHIVPPSDINEGCNGGDGAIDIYMDKMGFGALAQTMVYLPGCAARPTWMWIDPFAIQDPTIARDVFAHEFMHMIECTYSRSGPCDDYAWLEEAGGNWAIDFVYHDDPYEQVYAGQYYSGDYAVSIEKSETYGYNGYSDYVFLFYLSHKLGDVEGPQTIRRIFEDVQGNDSLNALDVATSTAGGLKTMWPKFATASWNDWQGKVADEFYKWDTLTWGLKKQRGDRAMAIDMKGLSEKNFDLDPFFSSTIEPLAAEFIDLKFPDDSARYVVFDNKLAELAPIKPHLHIKALMKINGEWKPEEDWTNAPFKTFCRDALAERIEELVVFYSNSNPDRPGPGSDGLDSSKIYLDYDDGSGRTHRPAVHVSNVGCWRWEGTSSLTTVEAAGPTTVESATATFDRFRFPGQAPEDLVGGDAFKSTNAGSATYTVSGPLLGGSCTISGTATGSLQGDGFFLADGGFILNFLQADARINRTLIGSGATHIDSVTTTIICSGHPETNTGPQDVHWLSLPEEGVLVGADGVTITGQWVRTDSEGMKTSVWNFRAVRE